jgi:hypothetical protein
MNPKKTDKVVVRDAGAAFGKDNYRTLQLTVPAWVSREMNLTPGRTMRVKVEGDKLIYTKTLR